MNLIPALSFNPRLSLGLPLLDEFKLIEGGFSELQWIQKNPAFQKIAASLHLARNPITETKCHQQRYISFLKESIESQLGELKISSIGLHLTGSRRESIGKYGFSSPYLASRTNIRRAKNFINQLFEATSREIWLENANFYERSFEDIVMVLKDLASIAESTGCKMILDLSHLYIAAKNLSIDPRYFFAVIPWSSLANIHISGIIRDQKGFYHDGHGDKVPEPIWALLAESLQRVGSQGLYVTLEHSMIVWDQKKAEYISDCRRLLAMLSHADSQIAKEPRSYPLETFVTGYFAKHFSQRAPNLKDLIVRHGLDWHSTIMKWQQSISADERVVFSKGEIAGYEILKTQVAFNHFVAFLKVHLPMLHADRGGAI